MRKIRELKFKNRLLGVWWMLFMVFFFWMNFYPKAVECNSVSDAFSVWWRDLKFLGAAIFYGCDLHAEDK